MRWFQIWLQLITLIITLLYSTPLFADDADCPDLENIKKDKNVSFFTYLIGREKQMFSDPQ